MLEIRFVFTCIQQQTREQKSLIRIQPSLPMLHFKYAYVANRDNSCPIIALNYNAYLLMYNQEEQLPTCHAYALSCMAIRFTRHVTSHWIDPRAIVAWQD